VKDKRVIVVGGGNVAMDCCRTPIRNGAKEVTIVYRRTKKELPADPHEVEDSEIEGVKYLFLAAPKRIVEENGKVTGLECLKMELGEPDASGRRRPIEVKGSEFIVPADIIIQAIGQDCDFTVLNGVEGIQLTKWKTIVADPDTFQTNISWIFTAGDVFNGPLTIVDACGNARRAAESIDQYLNNMPVTLTDSEKMDKVIKKLGAYNKDEKVGIAPIWERVPMPTISIDERVSSFAEVETGYSLINAVEEASRCMRCYQIGMAAVEKAV
jgi:formate dehydrogenase beta subunit